MLNPWTRHGARGARADEVLYGACLSLIHPSSLSLIYAPQRTSCPPLISPRSALYTDHSDSCSTDISLRWTQKVSSEASEGAGRLRCVPVSYCSVPASTRSTAHALLRPRGKYLCLIFIIFDSYTCKIVLTRFRSDFDVQPSCDCVSTCVGFSRTFH